MISSKPESEHGSQDLYEFARERVREQAVSEMKIYILFHQRQSYKLATSAAFNEKYALQMKKRSEQHSQRIAEPLPDVISDATGVAYDTLWNEGVIESGQILQHPDELTEYTDKYPVEVRMLYGFPPWTQSNARE